MVKRKREGYGEVARQVRLQRGVLLDEIGQKQVQRRDEVNGRVRGDVQRVGREDLLLAEGGEYRGLQHGVHAGLQRGQRRLQRVDQSLGVSRALRAYGVRQHLQESAHQPHAPCILFLLRRLPWL